MKKHSTLERRMLIYFGFIAAAALLITVEFVWNGGNALQMDLIKPVSFDPRFIKPYRFDEGIRQGNDSFKGIIITKIGGGSQRTNRSRFFNLIAQLKHFGLHLGHTARYPDDITKKELALILASYLGNNHPNAIDILFRATKLVEVADTGFLKIK